MKPASHRRSFRRLPSSCHLLAAAALIASGCRAAPLSAAPDAGAPPPVRGEALAGLESFDRLMTGFIAEHGLPGAALAVARDGRLLLAKGYGYGDAAQREPVAPDALFRIASISKPLTAVAVLQLVERGKLRLDAGIDEVLDLGAGIDGEDPDPRWRRITILQLLRHTAGFDRDASFDPMFRPLGLAEEVGAPPPATAATVIRAMRRHRLDFDPGERYAYSNLGYCLLGRAIEKASGESYEGFVRKSVLAPLGIERMRLGRTRLSEKIDDEVHYHAAGDVPSVVRPIGEPAPRAYGGFHLEAMDAHGGWVASAIDLVRFASAFDEPARSPLLGAESIAVMQSRPEGRAGHGDDGAPRDVYYGCGWQVRPSANGGANIWHAGSLPGTSTLLVRRRDGLVWAVLFNTREMKGGGRPPSSRIDPLLHAAAAEVESWPEGDLLPAKAAAGG